MRHAAKAGATHEALQITQRGYLGFFLRLTSHAPTSRFGCAGLRRAWMSAKGHLRARTTTAKEVALANWWTLECQTGTGTVTPEFRARVLKVSGSYRSDGVTYEPGQQTPIDARRYSHWLPSETEAN